MEGMTAGYARLCLQYVGAVCLRRGTVSLGDFTSAALADPATMALSRRLTVIEDDNPDPNAMAPLRVEVDLAEGRTVACAVTSVLGSPERPLSPEAARAKFTPCWDSVHGLPPEQEPRCGMRCSRSKPSTTFVRLRGSALREERHDVGLGALRGRAGMVVRDTAPGALERVRPIPPRQPPRPFRVVEEARNRYLEAVGLAALSLKTPGPVIAETASAIIVRWFMPTDPGHRAHGSPRPYQLRDGIRGVARRLCALGRAV